METLRGSLQDNVMTLLCYDEKSSGILVNTLQPEYFTTAVYRDIVDAALGYWAKYKKPIADHLPDVLEDRLSGSKADEYAQTFHSIKELSKSVNRDYIINELTFFIRQQTFKIAIKEAAQAVQDGELERAEEVMRKQSRVELSCFNAGTKLSDRKKFLECIDLTPEDTFPTGIKALDSLNICPARRELFLLLGDTNAGKSWFLVNCGKEALIRRRKVLHVSLEMEEKKVNRRYIQNFFSLSKREQSVLVPEFRFTEKGLLRSMQRLETAVKTLSDDNIQAYLDQELKDFRYDGLVVKEFASLNEREFMAYIDNLIHFDDFKPDEILFDYPAIMDIPANVPRHVAIGDKHKWARSLAMQIHCAMVAVFQSNREGKHETWLTNYNMAEDYSASRIADTLVTFNQSPTEAILGLARLFVCKAREEGKGQKIAMTQAYAIGQFCLDSYLMKHTEDPLWDILEANAVMDFVDSGIRGRERSKQSGNRRVRG